MYYSPKQSTFRLENKGIVSNKAQIPGLSWTTVHTVHSTPLGGTIHMESLRMVPPDFLHAHQVQVHLVALSFPLFCYTVSQMDKALCEESRYNPKFGSKHIGVKKNNFNVMMALVGKSDLGLSLNSATWQLYEFRHTILIL